MEIVDAKLTLKCEDGTELKADMTDAKVAAIVHRAAIMSWKWMRERAF